MEGTEWRKGGGGGSEFTTPKQMWRTDGTALLAQTPPPLIGTIIGIFFRSLNFAEMSKCRNSVCLVRKLMHPVQIHLRISGLTRPAVMCQSGCLKCAKAREKKKAQNKSRKMAKKMCGAEITSAKNA